METLPACPADVETRATILYANGFSGFQGPHGGGRDRFVLCSITCSWNKIDAFVRDEIPMLAMTSGATTLGHTDWIGRDFLTIHWSEYAKRFDVLTAMLQRGHEFQAWTRTTPCFQPSDGVFTTELFERRVIEETRDLLVLPVPRGGASELVADALYEEWNWQTEEGKAFARQLRESAKKISYDASRQNYFEWEIFRHYDPATLCTVQPPLEKEDTLCVVCMERQANTMVMPCQHCVVCAECSAQLAQRCAQCHQVIIQ